LATSDKARTSPVSSPGTYDVYYRGDTTSSSPFPVNGFARLRTGVVIPGGSSSLDVDIPLATVTGSFTVDGVAVPATSSSTQIFLENATTGDRAYIGYVGQDTYTARVIAGTYDIHYQGGETTSVTLPLNSFARLRTGVVIPTGSSSLNIDVPVATVTGSLTVGGVAVSSSSNFLISVRNATTGRDTFISNIGQSTYTARLVPGTYDVYYLGGTASSTAPGNVRARVRAGVVIPTGSSSLNIDVPIATVTGSLTVDGAADPSASLYAAVFLRNATTGDGVDLGYTGQGTYTAHLIPGTYDVYYLADTGSSILPNSSGRIRIGVVIPSGTSSLDVDVPVATVTGSLTVNGVAVPPTSNDGRITLRNVTTDWDSDHRTVGYTGQTTYTARLIPGVYDVYYALADRSSSTLPISSGRMRTGVVIPSGTSSLDIDIPVATVTGSLTVNGAAVPSTSDVGRITLRNATGHPATIGYTTQSTYTARLIPGTYDVHYALETAATGGAAAVPLNYNAKVRCFSVP
jgi:uncharacterized Zn-binding protein involved in type VI secretion